MSATTDASAMGAAAALPRDKGLKSGALGLFSTTVIGVASTAPAYSLAATLGFIVAVRRRAGAGRRGARVRPDAADRDRLQRAQQGRARLRHDVHLGHRGRSGRDVGWLGGWGIIAADVIVMASLAQIAGQYGFLLFNADGHRRATRRAAGCCSSASSGSS